MKGTNPYMDQGVDTRYCSGAALFGSDFDIDSERLEEDIEFIQIPAWRMANGQLIAIKDMNTSHIKNCIKMIYRKNGTWRHQYLRYFETELRNRKFLKQEILGTVNEIKNYWNITGAGNQLPSLPNEILIEL